MSSGPGPAVSYPGLAYFCAGFGFSLHGCQKAASEHLKLVTHPLQPPTEEELLFPRRSYRKFSGVVLEAPFESEELS